MQTLTSIQSEAVDEILAAHTQGRRAACSGMTTLNKSPRVLRGIRKRYEKRAARQGWGKDQIAAQWGDVKDMAVLEELGALGGVCVEAPTA